MTLRSKRTCGLKRQTQTKYLPGTTSFIEIKYLDNHQSTTVGATNISTEKKEKQPSLNTFIMKLNK